MCDKCLFESLVAAVKRQHDPMPQAPPAHRGRGRGRGRVASSYLPARSVTHPSVHPLGGPAGWTAETLKTAWTQQMERVYYRQLQKHGMAEENWEAAKGCDPMAPHESNVTVQEILKGVWTINGEFFVIEGECPVRLVGDGCFRSKGCLMGRFVESPCRGVMGRRVSAGWSR
jgi:hypothetical protein